MRNPFRKEVVNAKDPLEIVDFPFADKLASQNLMHNSGDDFMDKLVQTNSELRNKRVQMLNSGFGYSNPATGVGTSRDPAAFGGYTGVPYLNFQFWDNLSRNNWMAKRIIEVPAGDATRKGREFSCDDDSDAVEKRVKAENQYQVMYHVRRAMMAADLYGGSALIMSIKGDEDASKPLDITRIKKGSLNFFDVVIKDQLNPSGAISLDPYSSNYGFPEYYSLSNAQTGVGMDNTVTADNKLTATGSGLIHHSRVIVFTGAELFIYASLGQIGWGDSKLTCCLDLIELTHETAKNIGRLIEKANVDVIGIQDYLTVACAKPEAIQRLIQLNEAFVSNYKVLIKDAEDSFDRHELSGLAGMAEVMNKLLEQVGGAVGMPISKLLGTTIGGWSKGDNELTDYYDTVREKQTRIARQMEKIDSVVEMTTFGRIKNIDYEWITVTDADAKEQSLIELQQSQTDIAYLNAGVLTEQMIAEKLQERGSYNIDEEHINALSLAYDDDSEDNEELEPESAKEPAPKPTKKGVSNAKKATKKAKKKA